MKEALIFFALAVCLSACSLLSDPAEQAIVQVQGQRDISCRVGPECDAKWARVTAWVAANIAFKPETVTPTLIVTGHPGLFGSSPGVTISQASAGYGYETINFAASCGYLAPRCNPDLDQLKATFVSFVAAQ